ncbi:hypothetical protein EDWATA_01663, partial [Edwardsiella tarda ATCC 23685]
MAAVARATDSGCRERREEGGRETSEGAHEGAAIQRLQTRSLQLRRTQIEKADDGILWAAAERGAHLRMLDPVTAT